ncbi:TetR/AcrR family transcriptional regulator [Mycolicibacterium frederiksbergense]|uniref:TetR/AcrR family transcriptional regulator n=1 Tax=Mycolicibacterium frederiksbergense TaxID=117567 RepID=UPI00265C337F|nr:TetR/AcrR family transcriptional regulator [Mycolicibacterium frederiksbergense]MBX9920359.1 TetR/AcrR family transcriptional regulator [Mycolicibacterium frederiksbergense]MDO0976250.1 TetR/AcrR family transcriptional regulator [Mycolicibacterium frederiksbergense]
MTGAPGRPRDARVTGAILDAALTELAENGFRGSSMDGIARRAGVGKAALYRRWTSKAEVVAAAMKTVSGTDAPVPDTGSLRGDVRELLDGVVAWLSDPRTRRVYPDLLAEGQRDPALAHALMEYIGTPRRRRGYAVLERAAARGEVSPTADRELLLDALGALVFWRLIALNRPVSAGHLDQIADAVVVLADRQPGIR